MVHRGLQLHVGANQLPLTLLQLHLRPGPERALPLALPPPLETHLLNRVLLRPGTQQNRLRRPAPEYHPGIRPPPQEPQQGLRGLLRPAQPHRLPRREPRSPGRQPHDPGLPAGQEEEGPPRGERDGGGSAVGGGEAGGGAAAAAGGGGGAVFRVGVATAVRYRIVFWKTMRYGISLAGNVTVNDLGVKSTDDGVKLSSSSSSLHMGVVVMVVMGVFVNSLFSF
ncbi:hypothetical protein Syun_010208 [Stephania yunnanensis]|uniref:Uncharacterized protein n=1 Tax=Stephania yunnanensis TaxID=152371 RepID=A0AAP0PRF2_9MAGN